MYQHEFEPADGLISARQVLGNVAASEDKLKEGEDIACQLVDDFGPGEDLAVRVGYDDADGMHEAISRLEAVTRIKERLEDRCEEVKGGLKANVDSLRQLVLGSPGAAASAIGGQRAAIGAVVLQLLPLVVTDLPAALEEFPGLRDALSCDIVATRQTQISSGQVGSEQLEDLRTRVRSLDRRCAEEADKAAAAVRGQEEADSHLKAERAESARLRGRLTGARGQLEAAEEAAAGARAKLEKLRWRADRLEQDLSSEQRRAAKYKEEQESLRARLDVAETNAANHRDTVASLRGQLQSERESKAQETRRGTLDRLQKDLDAERASHASSRDSHAESMNGLKTSHQAAVERMQGQVDELRAENTSARREISGKGTELGKMQADRERLEKRLDRYKAKQDANEARLARVRSVMQETREEADRAAKEKEDALEEKDAELAKAHGRIASMARGLELAGETAARLRGERDKLREDSRATAASPDGLADAKRRAAELEKENVGLKIKYGQAEFDLEQAREEASSAEGRLRAKEAQLQRQALALRGESTRAENLEGQLSDRDTQLGAAVREIDALKDDVDELQRTVRDKEDLIGQKVALARQRDERLADQELQAARREQGLARELQHRQYQVDDARARLSDRERELRSAQRAGEQLRAAQELSDRQLERIESLQGELEGLQASGSARAEEITENIQRASLFLAEMTGLGPCDYMFSGLVGAIFQRDDVFCTRAAPDTWTILRSWDGSPADAAGARALVPRDASLQIGVVLLLGGAVSGKLNAEPSRAVLDGLITSAGSENTLRMPMAILTELARRVVGAIREAANVPVEFSLAFWQLMELVEGRIGRADPEDSPWRAHKASLFAELSRHPCSPVLGILRGDVNPESHGLCRIFGDRTGLCSHRDWTSAVVFDTGSRTLRFVNKALVSRPGMDVLRIGPGHDAVDLQLQPSDNTWLAHNI